MMSTNKASDKVKTYFSILLKQIGIEHSSINVSEAEGTNIVCTVAKVRVKKAKSEETKCNLIVKSASTDMHYRESIQSSTLCKRELYIYTNVLTEFEKFQTKRNVRNPFRSYPKYFGSNFEGLNEDIVMQDMTVHGYKVFDNNKCLDYNHVMLVLKEYGRLHALSFALRDQEPQTFLRLGNNTQEEFFSGTILDILKEPYEDNLLKALKTIDPIKHEELHKNCLEFIRDFRERLRKVLKAKMSGKYGVIVHGDCWINNILYKYGDAKNPVAPTKACFIDWQFSCLASPALDISYFLFASTNKKLRDEHYDDFIRRYHDSLCSFYTELTGNCEKCLPYEILQEHLRKFSVYAFFISVQAINVMLSKPKDKIDNDAQHKVMNILCSESENLTELNTRIKEILLDFDRLGYDFE